MNLDDLRRDIDRIDAAIVALLDERFGKALMARRLKADTMDPAREEAVLARVAALSTELADAAFTVPLFKEVIRKSRDLQDDPHLTVGFVGTRGSEADAAVRRTARDGRPVRCVPFGDEDGLRDAARCGLVDYACMPDGAVLTLSEAMSAKNPG